MKKKRKFLLTESMSAIIIQEERQIFTTEFRCKIINEKKILQTGSRGVNMWEEKQTIILECDYYTEGNQKNHILLIELPHLLT